MTHPAILKAQEVYDRPGELDGNEQTFLGHVHRITMHCARTKGDANRAWGDGTRAAAAVAFLADSKCNCELSRALTAYEQGLELQDEGEEIELAEAAE